MIARPLLVAGAEPKRCPGRRKPGHRLGSAPATVVRGCLLLAMMLAAHGACQAADPAAEKPLEFRRYFVPADRPQDWPKRNVPYLPVERQEFDRLVDAANSAPRGRAAAGATHVTRALYQANLAEPDLLRGEARFEVSHAGAAAALMTLEPFGLPLADARWENGGEATIGVQPSGKLAVVVARSGTLLVHWTLRGRRDPSGSVVFAFDLPPCAVSQLDLDLPEAAAPSITEGIAITSNQDGKKGRWRFQLAGRGRALLRLDTNDAHRRPRRLTLLLEKTTYGFSPGGIDLSAQLKLDVHREPLRHLEFGLDSPARVISVQYAGKEVPWSALSSTAEPSIRVDFPEPLLGPGRVITVTALAPLEIGPIFKLPRLRVYDVVWQEGDMTLLVPAPLALDTLLPQGCRQTKASPTSVGPAANSVELQLFSADASVVMGVSRRQQRVSLSSGSTVRFTPESVRIEARGRFESLDGDSYSLQADVGPGWQIESVTADRDRALANWSVDSTARPSLLTVQLTAPITASRPLELMIVGHRGLTTDLRFSGAMLEMLNFRDAALERRVMALEAPGALRVTLEGTDRPRIQQRSEVGESQRALLASSLSDVIFDDDANRRDWTVAIEPQTPRYTGDIRSTMELIGRQLRESYRIRCQPDGSRVDEVLVAFSQRREERPRFHADESAGAVTAERLDTEQQAGRGVPQAGEVWSLRLSQPAEEPFEIFIDRNIGFTTQIVPALVSLPEAVSQQGWIELRCPRATAVIESADRLEPVSPEPRAAGDYAAMVAAFRYDPLDELGNASPAALLVHPSDSDQPAAGTVWRLRLDSHYLPSGRSRHVAMFDLESHGRDSCSVRLPEGSELLRAKVDGALIADRAVGDEIKVTLPAKRQFSVLWVEFFRHSTRWGVTTRCEAPWPTIDLPIASREWLVSTTEQYEPLTWAESGAAWPRRLFGSLGRPRGQRPFDPSRLSNWKSLVGAFSSEDALPAPAVKLLEIWGTILARGNSAINDWGSLLAESETIEPDLLQSLKVDCQSLSALDFGSSTPVLRGGLGGRTESSSAARLALTLARQNLRCHGLALLVDGDQLILTSRSAALQSAGQDPDWGRSIVFEPAPAQAQAGQPSPGADSMRYLSLSAWRSLSTAAWDNRLQNSIGSAVDGVSRSWRIERAGAEMASVRLVRRDVITAAAWALAALVVAMNANQGRRHRRRIGLPLILTLAAIAAVWAPPCFMPLASGAILGSLVALFWSLTKPVGPSSRAELRLPAKVATTRHLAPLAGAVLLLSLDAAALGDDAPAGGEAKNPPTVHRVFVPLDVKNKPSSRYQVPTDFLDELRRRASSAAAEPSGWLIRSAAYQCALGREKADSPIGVKEFIVRYDLHLLSAEASVRIPAVRTEADLLTDSATVDGQPIELRWSDEGDALICDLAEPGVFQLEFRLAPVVAEAAETCGISVSVPKVAAATLDVLLPEGLSTVDIPGVKGELTVLDGGRRLAAQLGPIETMTIRWPMQAAMPPAAEAEELLWLKVRPGSVVLDVELNLNVTGGALRQIEFAADRRLRLLPGGLAAKERQLPLDADVADAPQITQLELERPLTGPLSLRLSFFMTGASGVGSIHLPVFHTINARVVRRWLAVTVDAGLEYEARDAEQLEALPATEFAAKWGNADAAVLRDALVYRLDGAEVSWNLATRSREPQTTVKESLSLSFQRRTALVRYDAQLLTTAGFIFQHRLQVPPEVEIERITVQEVGATLEEEGIDRVARWARGEPGIVTVFLNRRITGAQQLAIRGRLPVPANGRVNLPAISLESGNSAATIERAEVLLRTVDLYRQPGAEIVLRDAQGLSPAAELAPEPLNRSLGRRVLSRLAEETFSGTVLVTANQPQITGVEQFTVLRYVNQTWTADVEFHFLATDGVVDALHFDLPGDWAAHIETLAPAAAVDLSDQPGKNRKVFTVRPFKPLTGDCRVTLRASLKYAPGEQVRAPDVVALGLPAAERYWLLPQQVGIEAVNWDVQRLVPGSLPDDSHRPAGAESSAIFRAVGDHPQAAMSSVKAAIGIGRVRLADVRLAWGGARGGCGVAAFDLEPGGHSSCPIELAEGWRLLHVSVGGSTVMPLAQGAGRWEVPLRSDRLPQRLEATFAREPSILPAAVSLPILSTPNWLPEESLLTVHAPRAGDVQVDATRVGRESSDSARMESVTALIDLSEEIVATISKEDLTAWYLPWARWLLSCGRQVTLHKFTAATAIGDGPAGPLLETWVRQARRLHTEDVLARIANEPLLAIQTMEIWQQVHESSPAARFRWTGPSGPTQIRFGRPWSAWLGRLTETAWIAFLFLGALLLLRFTSLTDESRRWPHAMGVGLGLLWWLFCQPSAAGCVLIAWSLAAGLRSGLKISWRGRRSGG
jgi:hypothetical protein